MDSNQTARQAPTAAALERRARSLLGQYFDSSDQALRASSYENRRHCAEAVAHMADAVQRLGEAASIEARRVPADDRIAALSGNLVSVADAAGKIAAELEQAGTATSARLAQRIRREVVAVTGVDPVAGE